MSIVMISLSTIEDYGFLIPIMVGILSAKLTGDAFNEGLYDIHIKLQVTILQIPTDRFSHGPFFFTNLSSFSLFVVSYARRASPLSSSTSLLASRAAPSARSSRRISWSSRSC